MTKQEERSKARRKRRREKRRAEKKSVAFVPKKDLCIGDLDHSQTSAMHTIIDWWKEYQENGSVEPLTIGGYAGTGKSTLLGLVLPTLKDEKTNAPPVIAYVAFMGKAADVLCSKGLPASTIHSLIYNSTRNALGEMESERKDRKEIGNISLIVVDEASQVSDEIREDLEFFNIPLLYTGDHGQLPPVAGKGNIMEDPEIKLETPHRSALDSGIISLSTLAREGKRLPKGIYGVKEDTEVVGADRINDVDLLNAADVVICYSNRYRNGINVALREAKGFSGAIPAVGEKIICIKNNKTCGVFNGQVFTVVKSEDCVGHFVMDLLSESGELKQGLNIFREHFDGQEHPYVYGQTLFCQFEFAYAITGHKSQGSEWPNVLVVEEPMGRLNLEMKRRWMYTALTRASQKLTLVSRFR